MMNDRIKHRKSRSWVGDFAFMCCLAAALWIGAKALGGQSETHRSLLDAIRKVESNDGKVMVGDDGAAIGPYHIHKDYWLDAVRHNPSIGGTYQDCMRKEYAELVVLAYWDRYASRDASNETLARIHNGGPCGAKRKATLRYWAKVRRELAAAGPR